MTNFPTPPPTFRAPAVLTLKIETNYGWAQVSKTYEAGLLLTQQGKNEVYNELIVGLENEFAKYVQGGIARVVLGDPPVNGAPAGTGGAVTPFVRPSDPPTPTQQ